MSVINKLKKVNRMTRKLVTKWGTVTPRYFYPKFCDKLPLEDNLIFLESRNGQDLAGNIFYLLMELQKEEYKEYKLVITATDEKKETIQTILKNYGITRYELVRYASKDYYRVLATAKYLVADIGFPRWFSKRVGQIYLNTWHGTPWKCLGKQSEHDYYRFGNVQRNFMFADYLIYPNQYTRDIMLDDYCVRNIATKTKSCLVGYPRNSVFYKENHVKDRLKEEGIIKGNERLYFYMPTWREEGVGKVSQRIAPHIMMCNLIELDDKLNDDEMLFVKLHPLAKGAVDVSHLKHIKTFPAGYETYDFLTGMDVLLTDYSSVFFDYENSDRKIVLWVYDKEDYLADRGVYFDIDELPYPQVTNLDDLLTELRSDKQYVSDDVKKKFTAYDCKDAPKHVIELLLTGNSEGVEDLKPVLSDKYDGKRTVLVYISSLIRNGITSSFMNMLNSIDTNKYNVIPTYTINSVKKIPQAVKSFPKEMDYMPLWAGYSQTLWESFCLSLYYMKLLPTAWVSPIIKRVYQRDMKRLFPYMKLDTVIQFTGYEARKLMLFSQADATRVCLVHSDMEKECKTRNNQHKGVLRYCYNNYDIVAVVNEALIEPTSHFLKDKTKKNKIVVVPNLITDEEIRKNGDGEVVLNEETISTKSYDELMNLLNGDKKVFVTIGRYSPEKDHRSLLLAFDRLHKEYPNTGLILIGGHGVMYEDTLDLVDTLESKSDVVIIRNIRNPQPILRKCDCFVMSSLYEGLPMVIFEADIQGLPVITTDVSGMHYFMPKHNGTLTETGVEGVYGGLKKFMEGKVPRLTIDYREYNKECLEQLDKAIRGDKG